MSQQEWAAQALQSFDAVVQATEGLRSRGGQRRMAEQVAHTFARAQLGKVEAEDGDSAPAPPARSIAVVQAGTGVGKSLAYSVPAIAMALARGTRVLISTATVALQEQLVQKDLPALAARMPQPFQFALAEGRGRYVCKLKLERLAGTGEAGDEGPEDDLFAEEEAAARAARPRHETEARMKFYATMADVLARGAWDGDRDTLESPPEPEVWSPVAAEASSCTGKHCPAFGQCTYYDRRKALVAAQVIVANHDLLLSSIGARLLPELDNCLLVVDEAHHLPSTALDQFACEADLSRLNWIDKLASRALRIGTLMEVEEVADIPNHSARLRAALQDAARMVMDVYGDELRAPRPAWGGGRTASTQSSRIPAAAAPTRARVPGGALPEALVEPFSQVAHHAAGFLDALRAIAKALRSEMRDKPDEARRLSTLYAQIGALAPRLEGVHDTAQLEERRAGSQVVHAGGGWRLHRRQGPCQPGTAGQYAAQPPVVGRARAVLTSATLTSCGQFDFFLREAGLHGDDAVTTLEVPSPFDYALQGTLVATETQADPRQAADYTAEMVDALLSDLAMVEAGALVLFTSRDQMRQAVDALPTAMRSTVLVQTQMPRSQLLARHRERVAARAVDHLRHAVLRRGAGPARGALRIALHHQAAFRAAGRPGGRGAGRVAARHGARPVQRTRGARRLAQWVGRAIRTEEDRAHVYCYDRRLVRTAYGQRLLKGLPPFTLRPRA